jgi:uncharacterized protein
MTRAFLLIFSSVFFLLSWEETTLSQGKTLISLTLKGKTVKVEVVQTEEEKARGLMFRESLGKNEGMLFVYEKEEFLSFWMKNTRIPLSIAFIDATGRIVDIQDMDPFSLETHTSAVPAVYALEVNQGWFQRNGVTPGDRVNLPSVLRQ